VRTQTVRFAAFALFVLGATVWSVAGRAQAPAPVAAPAACETPDDSITLYAENVRRFKIGYGLAPGESKVPGPIIEMTEGECLEVTLQNDSNQRLSLHPHGVDYTVSSDGTPLNKGCVAPGGSRTYIWSTHEPGPRPDGTYDPGSAGYWHYHDHCMGSPHGTEGINRGLFGALVVRRPGDPIPDKRRTLVMKDISFSLRLAPNVPAIRANLGERVEFIIITHGTLFHTFHLHGHRWVDNRTGIPSGRSDPSPIIDNKTSGPADSYGFQVIAGEHVGPGAWMFHCHVQQHSDIGMAGLFVVADESGRLTPETRRAVRSFEMQH
jgi:manganese oxidase